MNEIYGQLPYPAYVMYIILVWQLIWKALALWRSARNNQRNWFIVMLIINTLGVLEIVYLFRFAKERLTLKKLAFWKKNKK